MPSDPSPFDNKKGEECIQNNQYVLKYILCLCAQANKCV